MPPEAINTPAVPAFPFLVTLSVTRTYDVVVVAKDATSAAAVARDIAKYLKPLASTPETVYVDRTEVIG